MKLFSTKLIVIIFALGLCSCKDDTDDEPVTRSFTYDFEEGTEGWTAGFSDYPAEWEEDRFEFSFEHTDLPQEVNENSQALMLSGRNISDDLFMFIKKNITGLKPDQPYLLHVEVELASQYPEESVGIGGSPGGSVYLKAGGTAIEPQPVMEDGEIRMNIDKGNQSQGGADMQVLGTVGIPGEEFSYQFIQRDNLQNPLELRSDASGNLWVIVGTDSGFEGTTTLFYNSITLRLEEKLP